MSKYKKAIMDPFRCAKRLNLQCFIFRSFVSLLFLLCVWFMFIYHKSKIQDVVVSTSETSSINTILLTTEDLKKAFIKSNGFFAAVKTNRGKTTGTSVCIVDPAIAECGGGGFASFLLYTLDHIIFCRALGINRAAVYWRACNSVCSRDPKVNSWYWYFEPVYHGLESKVENVFCPLRLDGPRTPVYVRTIIDNSFKNRTDVDGFEEGRIITTQERMRVNKLIQQYVKPNSRIKEKVRMFYQRYLAGFTVLGVHVRGTDHWMETSEKRLPPLMSWVKRVRSILETLPKPRKVFVASDNDEVIIKFVNSFGKETVVFTEAVRAKSYHDEIPPHSFKFEHNAADPYERAIGTQVLMDILLLAKSDHFLHTESSVASLTSYFNPHMTSYFLEEDEKPAKGSKELRERKRSEEARNLDLEILDKNEDFLRLAECFQRNSAESACPNTEKGIFISFQEAFEIFRPL